MGTLEISHFFKKNLLKFQENLISIFKDKNIRVRKIEILKEKLITRKQYKVTCLAFLDNHPFEKILFQIHDNKDYFNRAIFALKNFKMLKPNINVQRIYGVNRELKIVFMEYIEDDFLYEYIFKKKMNVAQIKHFVKNAGSCLARLHNFKPSEIPNFLSKRLNKKIESIILKRTLEFIKPNIEFFRTTMKKNLNILLERINYLARINSQCLIHGDYQPANFFLSKEKKIYIMDFDTLEIGNPARDLGRFIAQIEQLLEVNRLSKEEIKSCEGLFLKSYLKLRRLDLKPNLQFNLNTFKSEMIQYMILGRIWGNKIPSFKEIERLINYQSELLSV